MAHPTATRFIPSPPSCTLDSPTLACALIPPTCDNGFFCFAFSRFFFLLPLICFDHQNSNTSKGSALTFLAKIMFIQCNKSYSCRTTKAFGFCTSVRKDHLYNILVFENVKTWHSRGVKTSCFFLKGVSAPDGWLDCESAMETRSRIMSSEMWWCVVSIYLTDAQLHLHSPTGRCIV